MLAVSYDSRAAVDAMNSAQGDAKHA